MKRTFVTISHTLCAAKRQPLHGKERRDPDGTYVQMKRVVRRGIVFATLITCKL